MKVLQICHDFPTAVGGGATHVYQLSKGLAESGHQVTVFATDLIGKNQRSTRASEQMDGITVRRFRTVQVPLVGADVGNIAFGMLPAALTVERPDIIHVHTYRFFPTWLTPILRWVRRVPVVMTSHSAYEPTRPTRIGLFDRTWGKVIFKTVNRIIALTEIEKKYLTWLGAASDKIVIIPNAVDSALLAYQPNIQRFRDKHHLKEAKIVLFVGRIGLAKGLDTLVDAIPDVLALSGDDVRFVLVGPDWGDQRALEERARCLGVDKYILFTGALVGDHLLDAYHAADVVVLLSRCDASPIVLVEAMAAGKPIVATRVGGIPNLVQDGINGLLVEPGDAGAAAGAINRVLADHTLAERLGQAGKALVREKFQWSQTIQQVVNLYSELLRKGSAELAQVP